MIPKKLRFASFGPFNKEQTIDFSKFSDDRLFLISGKTGSGKTTIFDAVSFSLFGKPSGSLRDADSFKSHFSGDEDVCFCEFEFFSKGHNYKIYREPIQFKLKRTGNLVRENAVARLETDGKDTISGIDSVNKKIEEILGLNADQFKKIVMLPQGEFRKFLSDDSSEKQKILRKIFGTEIIDRFTEKLKDNASAQKRLFEDSEIKCQAHIANLYASENIALKEALSAENPDFDDIIKKIDDYSSILEKELSEKKAEIKKLETEKEKINLPYFKEINKKFSELEARKLKLSELEAKEIEIKNFKNDIEKIKLSKEIKPYEESYSQAKRRENETAAVIAKILEQTEKNNDLIRRSSEHYEKCREESEKLPEEKDNIQKLGLMLEAAKELSKAEKLEAETLKQKLSLQNEIKSAEGKCEYQKLIEIKSDAENRLLLFGEIKAETEKSEKLNEIFIEKSKAYKLAVSQFISSQSYQLAIGLEDGAPCPVCGSTEHPSLAKEPAVIVTDAELDLKKQESDGAYQDCLGKKSLIDGLFLKANVSSMDEIQNEAQILEASLKNADEKLSSEKYAGFSGQEFDIEALAEEIRTAKQNLAVLSERESSVKAKITELKSKTGCFDEEKIESEIEKKKAEIEETEKRFKAAEEYKKKFSDQEIELKARLNEKQSQLEDEKISSAQSKNKFAEILKKTSLGYEGYKNYISREIELKKLEEEVLSYTTEINTTRSFIESYSAQLQGLSPVNLVALQHQYDEIDSEITEKSKVLKSAELILSNNRQAEKNLKSELKKNREIYEKYTEYNHIYDVVQGKYSGNVNLERYILASYFDDIIDSANLRLEEMSNSRYTLKRRFEKEKGRRSSGLELEVMDAYSGTTRHVNTLSGGESFMVSLSLALGLADIMSEASGGIEVDTMFIDEGFGSLDSNSLSAAIECLEKIKETGRYIGIISHVSELKEKIPSKISVMQSNVGSYIEQE